jgi:PKD domain
VRKVRRSAARALGATLVALLASAPAAVGSRSEAHLAALYNLRGFPRASFRWIPTSPHTGERFLLVSTSTDLTSPIVRYAWDLADDGPFGAFSSGGPATSAAFSTPASHVVRLRVTAANGLSSVATETIHMSVPAPGVLTPFPNVRIAGRLLRSGVMLRLLSVRAPAHARIKVSCDGRGCPVRSIARAAISRAHHLVWTTFPRFERLLPPGITLEIRVSKESEIGAYTRFTVRRHELPVRADSCLGPTGLPPIACPVA